MKFKSKIDRWLNAILLLMCVITVYVLISAAAAKSMSLLSSGIILLILDAAFVLPVYFFTYYEITEDSLIIKSGYVFKKKIAIADIVGIAPTHNPVSSAALSINRIAVFYRKGDRLSNEFISPAEKDRFVEELVKINPEIIVKK